MRRPAQLEKFEPRMLFASDFAIAGDAPPLQIYGELQSNSAPDFVLDVPLSDNTGNPGLSPALADAHQITGVNYIHSQLGLDGTGQTVAIIDSGVAWDHAALGGGYGESYQVVGGWDFTENDADPYDDGPQGFHGTHVAGIVGSTDATSTGVAPGADLVSLRVFNDRGEGKFEWVEQALQWVYDHRSDFEHPITTVNLSLGARWNSDAIPSWAMLEEEFAQLESVGIFVAVAAGNAFNQFNAAGLAYPAASPHVVPVMSVDDADTLSSFSQRHPRALAAPGRDILSTIPDHASANPDGKANDFGVASGTSMASPYLAGAAVLVRQAMELAGRVNIDQEAIFAQLWDTADTFYDSVTRQTYRVIDVRAAVESLTPADDYGSTPAAAHQLGSVATTQTVSGVIGQQGDLDYFTFIAGATGSVKLTATTTVQPSWRLAGGGSASGASFSFAVLAGERYTFAIGSGAGLGAYQLKLELVKAQAPANDLGAVELLRLSDVRVSGESTFQLKASRTALLTVTGAYDAAQGSVRMELYENGRLLGASNTAGGLERIDIQARKGATYQLRVTGNHGDVDLVAANLLEDLGDRVVLHTTSEADNVQFVAGAGRQQLTINGVSYELARSSWDLRGATGDRLTISGSDIQNATLRSLGATVQGLGFTIVSQSFQHTTVEAGNAGRAQLYGSDDAESVSADPNQVVLGVKGGTLTARGFADREVYGGGGFDWGVLHGGAGADTFTATPTSAKLTSGGSSTTLFNFEDLQMYAGAGGADRANLYDSPGDDQVRVQGGAIEMFNGGARLVASGFERVFAWATAGGNDTAILEDTSGDDLFSMLPEQSYVTSRGYFSQVSGFERVSANVARGGADRAVFYDGVGDDRFAASPGYASMIGDGYHNSVQGNAAIQALARFGGHDRAVLHGGAGADALTASSSVATLTTGGQSTSASGFEEVTVQAGAGGADAARLQGSMKTDQLVSTAAESRLSGASYSLIVRGFGHVQTDALGSGDRAVLYQAPGDRYTTAEGEARLTGATTRIVTGFSTVVTYRAAATQSVSAQVHIPDIPDLGPPGAAAAYRADNALDALDAKNSRSAPLTDVWLASGQLSPDAATAYDEVRALPTVSAAGYRLQGADDALEAALTEASDRIETWLDDDAVRGELVDLDATDELLADLDGDPRLDVWADFE